MRNGCSLSKNTALLFVLLFCSSSVMAEAAQNKTASWPKRDFLPPIASINPRLDDLQDDTGLDSIDFAPSGSKNIQKTPRITRIDTPVQVEQNQKTGLLEARRKIEEADLERLWQATVQKNPVIRFSLEKLSAPADTLPSHSSKFLRRTLSTMISGATMASTMLPGGGAYRNMMSMAGGNALQNVLSGNTKPTPGALSNTELIELARLIDDLKLALIRNYQNYNASLQALSAAREATERNSAVYTQAQKSNNDMAVMAAASAYFQALLHETDLKQRARLQRLTLERIAGQETVSQLALVPTFSDTAIATTDKPTQQASQENVAEVIGPQPEPAITPSTKATVKANILKPATPATVAKTEQPSKALLSAKGPPIPQTMLELSPILNLQDTYGPKEVYGPPLPEPIVRKKVVYQKASKTVSTKNKNASNILGLAPLSDKIMDNANLSINSGGKD
jgi:hypothetical protein